MSIDRLLSQYGAPIASWPGEEALDEEAKANLAAAAPRQLQTEGGATDAGSLLPITRYPPRVGTDPSTWKTAGDVLASLDDGWRLEPFSRISAPFQSMLKGLREQPLLGPMVRPSQMHPQAFDQMTGDAMSVAGAGVMGNIPRVLAGAPAGTIDFGMFGGRRGAEALAAKGEPRPLQALDMVEAMEKAGKSRDEIWQATAEMLKDTPYAGAFRGVDQKPRFEFDDSGAGFTPDTPASRLPDMVRHDLLFDAYPSLMDVAATRETAVDFWGNRGANGYFDPERNLIGIHDELGRKSGKSTALHEMTHAGPQEVEGFARGYNPTEAAKDIAQARLREQELRDKTQRWQNAHSDEARGYETRARNGDPEAAEIVNASQRWMDQLGAKSEDNPYGITRTEAIAAELGDRDEILQRGLREYNDVFRTARLDPHELYKMYAGETEARTVQKRMDLSPEERRARPPWMDYDVPEKDQIVRFGNGAGAAESKPLDLSPEARLARAQEMGFDTSKILYHGTQAAPFDAFSLDRIAQSGEPDVAVYLTPSSDMASSYAGATAEGKPNFYKYLRTALQTGSSISGKDKGRVLPVYARMNNPKTIRMRDPGYRDTNANEIFKAKREGHDGLIMTFNDSPDEYVVFDPANIRSVNADFDPSKSASPNLMASIDPSAPHPIDKLLDEVAPPLPAASVPVPVSLDPLGYYSAAAEAARGLKQLKGTPEQMLAQLKKAGARDAEIEATGLAEALAGKKSVTRDEIVKHLEGNRVGLSEAEYRKTAPTEYEVYGDDPQKGRYFGADRAAAEAYARETGMDIHEISLDTDATRWSDYSLDPSNPTYRETVLHLPEGRSPEIRDKRRKIVEVEAEIGKLYEKHGNDEPAVLRDPEFTRLNAELTALTQPEHGGKAADFSDFRSGHFPEPNIVGHMMTSMTRHEGKPVFTIDQIQSDWGQKLRDGGVRDEAKIAALKARMDALDLAAKNNRIADLAEAAGFKSRGFRGVLDHEEVQKFLQSDKIGSDEGRALLRQINEGRSEWRRLEAEYNTANASSPGHPLVNTTDRWTNVVLRRALHQAAESNAEYIAIPSGRTVESYNPQGSSEGVDAFYDKIVPKNLKNILTSLDKKAPAPIRVETLDSPSGATGLGSGFTLFPLTPAIKERIIKGGQPLFKAGGAVLPSRVPDFTPAQRALQAAVLRRGARDANEILDLYSKD